MLATGEEGLTPTPQGGASNTADTPKGLALLDILPLNGIVPIDKASIAQDPNWSQSPHRHKTLLEV